MFQRIPDSDHSVSVVLVTDVPLHRNILGQRAGIGVKIPQQQVGAHPQTLSQPVTGITADHKVIMAQADLMFFDSMLIPCGKNHTARHLPHPF